MIQTVEKTWQTSDEDIQIVDRDGRLGVIFRGIKLGPYFEIFLDYYSWESNHDLSMSMIKKDINLKNYRDSLIKDVDHIDKSCLYEVLDSAFNEDYMCEYLYTYDNISRNLSKKVLNDIVYEQRFRIYNLAGKYIPDVKRYAVKALSNLKSNNDMIKISEDIRIMLLEKFMNKYCRARLQKVMKEVTNEQFKGHKRIAEAEVGRQR